MAAFTKFTDEALQRYLRLFNLGSLEAVSPIEGGTENSNYFVSLNQSGEIKHYVLTLVEQRGFDEIPFFCQVMASLGQLGLPVVAPMPTLDGMTVTIFCGKPALLLPRVAGNHVTQVTPSHCRQLGQFMAQAHQGLQATNLSRTNPYGPNWFDQALNQYRPRMNPLASDLLGQIASEYRRLVALDLPRGLIHGDLFVDNALFLEDGQLSGVIDFHHACTEMLIQDLAIAINDWCVSPAMTIDSTLKNALLAGYEAVRPLLPEEHAALAPMQRCAAGCFALTRFESGIPPLKNPYSLLKLASTLNTLSEPTIQQ